jgi:hypothetical protein
MSAKQLTKMVLPGGVITRTIGYTPDRATSLAFLNANRQANTLIPQAFGGIRAYAGQPIISLTSSSTVIQIPYMTHEIGTSIPHDHVNTLGSILEGVYQRPVELKLIRLKYPYLDAYILAQYISDQLKSDRFVMMVKKLFSSIALAKSKQDPKDLPAWPIGLKVQLGGRLMNEPIRPRQTKQVAQVGSLKVFGMHSVQTASFTQINGRGAYTVKVFLGQTASNRGLESLLPESQKQIEGGSQKQSGQKAQK